MTGKFPVHCSLSCECPAATRSTDSSPCTVFKLFCLFIRMAHHMCLMKTVGSEFFGTHCIECIFWDSFFFFAKIFELVAAGRIDCADGGDPSGSLCTVFTWDLSTRAHRILLSYGTNYAENALRVKKCTFWILERWKLQPLVLIAVKTPCKHFSTDSSFCLVL